MRSLNASQFSSEKANTMPCYKPMTARPERMLWMCYIANSVKLTQQSNYRPPLCHATSQITARYAQLAWMCYTAYEEMMMSSCAARASNMWAYVPALLLTACVYSCILGVFPSCSTCVQHCKQYEIRSTRNLPEIVRLPICSDSLGYIA